MKKWIIIPLFLVLLLTVPFPNFYKLCTCPEFVGATQTDCSCYTAHVFLNGLMLFINFASFNIYSRMAYFQINYSWFLFSIVLSGAFSYLLYKGVSNKNKALKIISWFILIAFSLVILYALFGLLFFLII